jgi:transcription elongation factor GreA
MSDPEITLFAAVQTFLGQLGGAERPSYQQELARFLRWYGRDRSLREVTAPQIDAYVEETQRTGGDYTARLQPLRDFLVFARKQGYTATSLASVIKMKRPAARKADRQLAGSATTHHITREGYERLQEELAHLKAQRPKLAQELRSAAADKDFRENAPYDAAKEKQGKVEARIRELEAVLKSAAIIEDKKVSVARVEQGHRLTLLDINAGEEVQFTLVNPREVDLKNGKISVDSPTGKALLGRGEGDEVEVAAPAGTVRYKIIKIQ